MGNPCYVGCTDVPAEELGDPNKGAGYVCAPCPSGLEGDGENCTGELRLIRLHGLGTLTIRTYFSWGSYFKFVFNLLIDTKEDENFIIDAK